MPDYDDAVAEMAGVEYDIPGTDDEGSEDRYAPALDEGGLRQQREDEDEAEGGTRVVGGESTGRIEHAETQRFPERERDGARRDHADHVQEGAQQSLARDGAGDDECKCDEEIGEHLRDL